MPFVSKLFPKWHCKRLLRTDPLKALVIGGFVRGLSMRDVESLCEEAGLGRTSKSTVATICAELHERFEAFCRRSLCDGGITPIGAGQAGVDEGSYVKWRVARAVMQRGGVGR